MKAVRLGQQTTAEATEQEHASNAPEKGGEIRLLDDLELVLAAGGDQIITWP